MVSALVTQSMVLVPTGTASLRDLLETQQLSPAPDELNPPQFNKIPREFRCASLSEDLGN